MSRRRSADLRELLLRDQRHESAVRALEQLGDRVDEWLLAGLRGLPDAPRRVRGKGRFLVSALALLDGGTARAVLPREGTNVADLVAFTEASALDVLARCLTEYFAEEMSLRLADSQGEYALARWQDDGGR